MRRIIPIIFLVVLGTSISATAQLPIGHASPVGSHSPTLLGEPLWFGNAAYAYHLQDAPPGGQALLVVSLERSDRLIGGLQVYPSLASGDLLFVLTGPIDGAGQASFPRPLPGPEVPALAGLDLYAQMAVTDPTLPGALGTTQGLLLEVTLSPRLAFANYQTGLVLIDPIQGASQVVTGTPPSTVIEGAVFGNGGHDLFAASFNGLFWIDTQDPAPHVDRTIPGSWTAVEWDRVHQRLYALNPAHGYLAVIDGDRSSPGFFSVMAQRSAAANSLDISADGTRLALGSSIGTLELLDTDPSSASYLESLPTPPSPIVFGYGVFVGPVSFTPDGRVAAIRVDRLLGEPTSELHRLDVLLSQWIDHDALAPGYQPLSAASDPRLPPIFSFFPTRDGSAALLSGSSAVLRIDFSLSAPDQFAISATPIPPATFTRTYHGLSPSSRFLVEREYMPLGAPAPNQISLIAVSTGQKFSLATLDAFANSSSQTVSVWR